MPDITMCKGTNKLGSCPLKDKCYRHKATPTPNWQSWFATAPFKEDKPDRPYCDYLWPIEEETSDDKGKQE